MSVSVNSYYTVSTVAELKALAGRPSVVQVLAGNGVYNWTEGNTTTGDDVTVIEPTAPTPAGRYILSVTDYPLTVENLAALKALTTRPKSVSMAGRTAVNDGGGGIFHWVAADATTADDALVVAPTSGTAGRWKRIFSGPVNLRWFGATGVAGDNQTTAISDWLNAARGRGGFVPAGTYKWTSALILTLNAPTRLTFAVDAKFVFDNGTATNTDTALTVVCTGYDFSIEGGEFDGSQRCNCVVDVTQDAVPVGARPNFSSFGTTYHSTRWRAGGGQPASENKALQVRGAFRRIRSEADTFAKCYRDATAGTPGSSGTCGAFFGRYGSTGPDPETVEIIDPFVDDISTDATGIDAKNVDADGIKIFQGSTGQATPGGMRAIVRGGTFRNCKGRGLKGQLHDIQVDGAKFIVACEPITGNFGSGGSVLVDFQIAGGSIRNCSAEYATWGAGKSPFVVDGATAINGCTGFSLQMTVNTARGRALIEGNTIYNNVAATVGSLAMPFAVQADSDAQNSRAIVINNEVIGGACNCLVYTGEMGMASNVDRVDVSDNFATLVLQSLICSASLSNLDNLRQRYVGNANGTQQRTITVGSINDTTDVITSTTHGLVSGQVIWLVLGSGATIPAGLTESDAGTGGFKAYWTLRIDADTFKLADSPADVISNTAVNMTSAGSGTITFVVAPAFHTRLDGVIFTSLAAGIRTAYQNDGAWRGEDPANTRVNALRATSFGGMTANSAVGNLMVMSIQEVYVTATSSYQFRPTGYYVSYHMLICDEAVNNNALFFTYGSNFTAAGYTGSNISFGTTSDPGTANKTSVWKSDIRGNIQSCISITNRTATNNVYRLITFGSS